MPGLMRNWLFEHLTFKIQHLVNQYWQTWRKPKQKFIANSENTFVG
jgi:hypothetical protein